MNYELRMKQSGFRYAGYLIALSLAYGLFTAIVHRNYLILPLSVFLCVYWYSLRWQIYRFQLTRDYKKKSEDSKKVQWAIDDEGFKGYTSKSKSEFTWDTIKQVVCSKHGFLLYQYPIVLFLPTNGFSSAEDFEWFKKKSQSKVEQFIEAT